jgi:uncharacterized membrane-anchored protein
MSAPSESNPKKVAIAPRMLNWADLCSLLTVFMSTLTGVVAAHDQKAGWWAVISFAVVGFLLGYAFAFLGSKLAYAALHRSLLPRGQRETVASISYGFLYMLVPFVFVCVASAATVLFTIGVLRLFQ